jgi:hypothetical protein
MLLKAQLSRGPTYRIRSSTPNSLRRTARSVASSSQSAARTQPGNEPDLLTARIPQTPCAVTVGEPSPCRAPHGRAARAGVYSKGLSGLSTRLAYGSGGPSQRPSSAPALLPAATRSPSTALPSFLCAEGRRVRSRNVRLLGVGCWPACWKSQKWSMPTSRKSARNTAEEPCLMNSLISFQAVFMSLCLVLASCSATRHVTPTSADLPRLVLVIRETPDGQVTHSWQDTEDFDPSHFMYRSSLNGAHGQIVLTGGPQDDCYAQYLECYYLCRKTPVPPEFDHYLHDFGPAAGHERYCSEKCMRKYTECIRARGQRQQQFTAIDDAVDWLKRNHKAVLVGTLIVIAGVAFIVVSAGAGLIVLVPVVLVASGLPPITPPLAAVSP